MNDIEQYLKDDPSFATEFIHSLQSNLIEFRDSLIATVGNQEQSYFLKTHHKLKSTLSMVGNQKLNDQTDIVLTLLAFGGVNAINTRIQNSFCRLCNTAVESLSLKLETLQTSKQVES
jgi:HPt (histidine-containing phosphotransfer) domain-containing protein